MSTLKISQKITPFLWFDNRAEEAINFYTSIFPNSRINSIAKWPEGGAFPSNTVQTGSFVLDGLQIYAFDAGPQFQFTEAISFFVTCKDQQEVDYYWDKLSEGGAESVCGWLKDKFGLSWQIVPEFIAQKLADGEPQRLQNMMQAVMQMKKLDVAALEEAYNS